MSALWPVRPSVGALPRVGWASATALLLAATWAWAPPLALVAPLPLLHALRGATVREGMIAGFVMAAGSSAVLAGLVHAGFSLYLALALSYGLVGALFGGLHALCLREPPVWARPWLSASLWVLVEWGHMQVPYAAPNLLGDTQWYGPWLPLARLGGTLLVAFVLVLLCACAREILEAPRSRSAYASAGGALAVWVGLALATPPAPVAKGEVTVASVQGGLPTWLYARAERSGPYTDVPERIYRGLTEGAPPAALTVWPETAVWQVWGEAPQYERALHALVNRRGGSLLVGVPRRDSASSFANSAVLLQPGQPEQVGDKRRLALIAEAGFSPGAEPAVISLSTAQGAVPLGVVFCLETVVPTYVTDVVRAGAQAVVVLAEGGRFGETFVGEVHANHSVIRAVESGRAILHAGQHGFTRLIAADGTATGPLAPYHAAVLSGRLTLSAQPTPYVTYGDWPALVALLVWIAGLPVALLGRFPGSRKRG